MGFSFTIFNDREAESAERDQPARMCSLILLYNSRKKIRDGKRHDKGQSTLWKTF